MMHQVIAFARSMRCSAVQTAAAPQTFAAGKVNPAPANRTVALTIALRYLATRNRIPEVLFTDIRQRSALK
jgi:hypothetical protein